MAKTTIRPKQRKLAERYVAGDKYADIAKDLMPTVENPRQAVYNRLQDKGTQAAIAELITESNVIRALTTDKILYHIQKLALDETLKPKEREGYLRMLAEYKALLKQVNLNETVTSSDALVEQAEQALVQLKAQVNSESTTSNASGASAASESGETDCPGSGKEVEATPRSVSENK